MPISLLGFLGFVCAAAAGTIKIQSAAPLTFRLDGEVVARLTNEAVLTGVAAGGHRIEALDPFGKVIASTDVILREGEPLWFECANRRFLRIDPVLAQAPGDRTPLTDAQYSWLEHRIVRKRKEEKKVKRLAEVVDRYWFEMRHVNKLLAAFPTLESRVQASKMLAPRTIDPEKTRAIEGHFPPGDYRDRALSAFAFFQRPEVEE
jgi:hypothetical protein